MTGRGDTSKTTNQYFFCSASLFKEKDIYCQNNQGNGLKPKGVNHGECAFALKSENPGGNWQGDVCRNAERCASSSFHEKISNMWFGDKKEEERAI